MDPDKKLATTDSDVKASQPTDRHVEDVAQEGHAQNGDMTGVNGVKDGDGHQLTYVVDGETRVYVPGSAEERRMVLKIDLHMFSCCCVMYLLNYLDRTNIGNAKVAGLQADLHLSSSDYSEALLIFFVGYLGGQIPSNLVLSRVRPSLYLPGITFIWGLIGLLISQCKTKASLVGVRFLLGTVESGFFAGVIFLLSSWYRKHELGKRMAYLYAAAILSGAFGGVLAGAVISGLEGARGIRGWQWLFIIEGAITMFISIIVVFILPNWPHNTRWLTPAEKELARVRLRADLVGVRETDMRMPPLKGVICALTNWRTWLLTFMYMMVVGAGTITYFIPTLTEAMGYKGTSAQWMTIPVYMVTLVFSLGIAWSADYHQERAFHVAIPVFFGGLFFILSLAILNNHARYVFLCFGFSGVWGPLPQILAWVPNIITHPDTVRGTSLAAVNMIANLASIYGSYLWPSSSAPDYHLGFGTTSAMCFACCIAALFGRYIFPRHPYQFDSAKWLRQEAIDGDEKRVPTDESHAVDNGKPAGSTA